LKIVGNASAPKKLMETPLGKDVSKQL